jgi:hypothetical protein
LTWGKLQQLLVQTARKSGLEKLSQKTRWSYFNFQTKIWRHHHHLYLFISIDPYIGCGKMSYPVKKTVVHSVVI